MRYDWPADLIKPTDLLEGRMAHNLTYRDFSFAFANPGTLDALLPLLASALAGAETWLPLGPSAMLNGQAAGNPMVAGRVRELFVNREGTRAYAGTANGGVWYWEESFGAWRPVGAWGLFGGDLADGERAQLSLTIGALSVEFGRGPGDVDQASGDIVYAGTGELRPGLAEIPGRKLSGIGVLKLEGSITSVLNTPEGNPWQLEGANVLRGLGIYRLARNPGFAVPGNPVELVAATSDGLFFRSGAFAEGGDWTKVANSKFNHTDSARLPFTDAIWSATTGLWVATVTSSGEQGLYNSPTGPGGTFTHVDLPNIYAGSNGHKRLVIVEPAGVSNRLYVLGKRTGPDVGHAALWRITDAAGTPVAKRVANVPIGAFASTSKIDASDPSNIKVLSDQAHYDMAMEVIPDSPAGTDRVFVGGPGHGGSAALSELNVTSDGAGGFTTNFTTSTANEANPSRDVAVWRGRGIHADVHQILNRPTGLWVACDGGVFRRDPAGNVRPLNLGLAVLQPGYIASHPTIDGSVLGGLQDNGVMQRAGDTVWYARLGGDGGGVLHHPTQTRLFVGQYIHSRWRFREARREKGSASSVSSTSTAPPMASNESNRTRSGFYSSAAVAPSAGTGAQVCIGTDRLWYCDNWGNGAMTWATIPTNTTIAAAAAGNATRDQIGGGELVRAIKFESPGTTSSTPVDGVSLLVLTDDAVRRYRQTVTSGTASWTSHADAKISAAPPGGGAEETAANSCGTGGGDELPFYDHLPKPSRLALTDVASHSAARGSCYVTTTGRLARGSAADDGELETRYDTLWWYNGQGTWFRTNLLTQPVDTGTGTAGARAGAHSVVVDPDGIPDFTNQADVLDGSREDYVYVGTRLGVWRGRLSFVVNPEAAEDGQPDFLPSWAWQPFFEGLPQTLVEDLSIHKQAYPAFGGIGGFESKFLRAAVVSRGVWERDISTPQMSHERMFLRSYGLDTGRRPIDVYDTDHYRARTIADHHASSPDIVAWNQSQAAAVATAMNGRTEITEADTFTLRTGLRRGVLQHSDAANPGAANVAQVLVHHRTLKPLAANQITVHLFAWINRPLIDDDANPATPSVMTPLQNMATDADLRNAILSTVGGTVTETPTLKHLGAANPSQPVDARMPRPAVFSFDLSHAHDPAHFIAGPAAGTVDSDQVILIAVLDGPNHRITAADLSPSGLPGAPTLVDATRRSALIAAARFEREFPRPPPPPPP